MTPYVHQGEVTLRRFRRLLATRWWVPCLMAVVFAALFGFSSTSTYASSATVNVVPSNALLPSIDLEPDTLSKALPINVDVSGVKADSFDELASTEIGQPFDSAVTVQDLSATLTASSGSAETTATALTLLVSEVTRSRFERFQALIDELIAEQTNATALYTERIAALDRQLADISDPSGSLASALLADRSNMSDSLVESERATAVFQGMRDDRSAAYSVTSDQTITTTDDRALRLLAGASLGLMVGGLVLLLLAATDNRVRSRYDIALASRLPTLAVQTRGKSDDPVRVTQMIAASGTNRGSTLTVIPADSRTAVGADLETIRQTSLASGSEVALNYAEPLATSLAELSNTQPVVIAATYGSTTRSELQQCSAQLAIADRQIIGVVLLGVPARDSEWASAAIPDSPLLD